jgi:sporulation protein YlmC with PRC-barrel domain
MELPIKAEIECCDGRCGHASYIVLNPVTDEVTHVVVKEPNLPNIEHLVPIKMVTRSDDQHIYLNCSRLELEKMEPFIETEFIRSNTEEYSLPFDFTYSGTFMLWPYVLAEPMSTVRIEHLPPSELALRRGAQVHATDGHVGEVDELVIDPENDQITYILMRRGHYWGDREVTIPVSAIDRIHEDMIYLKLDKVTIESLPAVKVSRRWK